MRKQTPYFNSFLCTFFFFKDAAEEDDGVLLSPVVDLSAVLDGADGDSAPATGQDAAMKMAPPFLLVLDAKTMTEVTRVEFDGVEWHRDIHGIFQPL